MVGSNVKRIGDCPMQEFDIVATNRTGGTITQGYVGALDEADSDGDVTASPVQNVNGGWANIIAIGSAALAKNTLAVFLRPQNGNDGDSLADNAPGIWRITGFCKARVANGVAKGNTLAADSGTPGTLKVIAAGANAESGVAKARVANSSGVVAVREVMFWGYAWTGFNAAVS